MEDKNKKVIYTSLAGLLLGSLLYIAGLSFQLSYLPLIADYAIALLLYIASFLAVHNNNKSPKIMVFTYIEILALFLIILITFVFINILF